VVEGGRVGVNHLGSVLLDLRIDVRLWARGDTGVYSFQASGRRWKRGLVKAGNLPSLVDKGGGSVGK